MDSGQRQPLSARITHVRLWPAVSSSETPLATVAGLVESSIKFTDRHTVFGRGEVGGMPAHHMHAHEYSTTIFAIGKGQIGYVRHLRPTKGLRPGIGGTVAIRVVPAALAPRYSGRTAPTFGVFVSLRAARHQM